MLFFNAILTFTLRTRHSEPDLIRYFQAVVIFRNRSFLHVSKRITYMQTYRVFSCHSLYEFAILDRLQAVRIKRNNMLGLFFNYFEGKTSFIVSMECDAVIIVIKSNK